MTRILIVHGHEPSGHAAAAAALEEAARARGAVVSRVQVSSDHHPVAARAAAAAYHAVVRASPSLLRALNGTAARAALRGVRAAYLALGGGRRLREGVAR